MFKGIVFRILGAMVVLSSATVDATVGSLEGSFSVPANGSSNYAISILSPPGINDLKPNLALKYNSNSGNGYLGLGWNLAGLSSIHRCQVEKEGMYRPVYLNNSDRFCLDGVELALVGGVYGEDKSEYRTVDESFRKIIAFSSSTVSSGPSYFRVFAKDGSITEYGNSISSKSFADNENAIYRWSVSKKKDRAGNFIQYDYENSNNEHKIKRISYNNELSYFEFSYEDRGDYFSYYNFNSIHSVKSRISKISAFTDSSLIWEYSLTYHSDDSQVQASRLHEVSLCDESFSCIAPSTFEWNEASSGLTIGEVTRTDFRDDEGWNSGKRFFSIDVNGDGRTDIVARGGNGAFLTYLSNGSKFEYVGKTSTRYYDSNGWNSGQRYFTMDINGDGRVDLLARGGNGRLYTWLSNGTTFDYVASTSTPYTDSSGWNSGKRYFPMDVNGDGREDFVSRNAHGAFVTWLSNGKSFVQSGKVNTGYSDSSGWNSGHRFFLSDINGDGRGDFVARSGKGTLASWLSNGVTFERVANTSTGYSDSKGWNSGYRFFFGDINGDRKTDFLARDGNGRLISWLSNGRTFNKVGVTETSFTDSSGWNSGLRYFQVDLNGDGRFDLLARNRSGTLLPYVSNGVTYEYLGGVTTGYQDSSGWNSGKRYFIGDFDGDSTQEILTRSGAGTLRPVFSNNSQSDKITVFEDGVGLEQIVEYSSLHDHDVYSDSDAVSYPLALPSRSHQVVSSYQTSDGIGGYNYKSYSYENMRLHNLGFGNLGFSKVTLNDEASRTKTTTTYSHDFGNRTHGLLKSFQVSGSNGVTLGSSNKLFSLITCGQGLEERYFPYVSGSTVVNRSYENIIINEISENTAYYNDCFGNVKSSEVKTTDIYGSHNSKKSYTYHPADTENWFISQVEFEISTNSSPDMPVPQQRTLHFPEYHATYGVVKKEIVEPGPEQLLKTYEYDSFGNRISVREDGAGVNSRLSEVIYDAAGLFVARERNAEGHEDSIDREYNRRFGYPTRIVDVNGNSMSWTYNGLGETTSITYSDGTQATKKTLWCNQAGAGCRSNNHEKYVLVFSKVGRPTKYTYFDMLGRKVRVSSPGFNGQLVHQLWEYDQLGNEIFESIPSEDLHTAKGNYTYYDDAFRPYRYVNSDGGQTEVLSFNGLSKQIIDELGNIKTVYKDSVEQIKRIVSSGSEIEYFYDGFGQVTKTVTNGVYTTIRYDSRGRKSRQLTGGLSELDPNAFEYAYLSNATGETVISTQPDGTKTCQAYDNLGRVVLRVYDYKGGVPGDALNNCAGDEQNKNRHLWRYDIAPNGVGALAEVKGVDGYNKKFTYDQYSRKESVTTTIDGRAYTFGYGYDPLSGRPDLTVYPSGTAILRNFTEHGYLENISNADSPQEIYWKALEVTPWGDVSKFILGNGVETRRNFQPETGRMERDTVLAAGELAVLSDMEYDYDLSGNLIFRKDHLFGNSETIKYDRYNQIDVIDQYVASAGAGGLRTIDYEIDRMGNINFKPDVGSFTYGNVDERCDSKFNDSVSYAGPYAVTQTNGNSSNYYCYDSNGNMIGDSERSLSYTFDNKPSRIVMGQNIVELKYGPERALIKRLDIGGSNGEKSTIYPGTGFEHIITANSEIERVLVDDFLVISKSAQTEEKNYLHKDHLGSLIATTNNQGEVIERFSFDAWGKRRTPDTWLSNSQGLQPSKITQKGFTGHQGMESVGLIHMKGRAYDPVIGRFVSPDPILQDPGQSLSYNRYAYVYNNPLTYFDPYGFSAWTKIRGALKSAIGIGLASVGAYFAPVTNGFSAAILFPIGEQFMLSGQADLDGRESSSSDVYQITLAYTPDGGNGQRGGGEVDFLVGRNGKALVSTLPKTQPSGRDWLSIYAGEGDYHRWGSSTEGSGKSSGRLAHEKLYEDNLAYALTLGDFIQSGYDLVDGSYSSAALGLAGAVFKPLGAARKLESKADKFATGNVDVYQALAPDGSVLYVGITNNFLRRQREHASRFVISLIDDLTNLTRADAKAVEQVLIERYGRKADGGTLENILNSISPKNSIYESAISRGHEILNQRLL